MMTAIETAYKGYRFRSRLEARWAVFMDVMGIPYEYEREASSTLVKAIRAGYSKSNKR